MLTKTKELQRPTGTHHTWDELAQQWVAFQAVRKAASIGYMSSFAAYIQTNHINAYSNLSAAIITVIESEYDDAAYAAFKTGNV